MMVGRFTNTTTNRYMHAAWTALENAFSWSHESNNKTQFETSLIWNKTLFWFFAITAVYHTVLVTHEWKINKPDFQMRLNADGRRRIWPEIVRRGRSGHVHPLVMLRVWYSAMWFITASLGINVSPHQSGDFMRKKILKICTKLVIYMILTAWAKPRQN